MNQDTIENLIVVKRSGQRVSFNGAKIAVAIKYAFDSVYEQYDEKNVNKVYKEALDFIRTEYEGRKTINVEDIQDVIEKILQKKAFHDVYLSFNEYRLRRAASREVFSMKQQHKFVKAIEKIGLTVKNSTAEKSSDLMFHFGKKISTEFTNAYLLESKYVRAQEEGVIGIGDFESYALATTSSSHLDFQKLNASTLPSYTDQLIDKVFHYKMEQYGEHTICSIDKLYEPVLLIEFKRIYKELLLQYLKLEGFYDFIQIKKLENWIQEKSSVESDWDDHMYKQNSHVAHLCKFAYKQTHQIVEQSLYDQFTKLLVKLENMKVAMNHKMISISIGSGVTKDSIFIQNIYLKGLSTLPFLKQVVTVYKMNDESINIEYVRDLIIQGKNITCLYLDKEESMQKEVFSNGAFIYDNVNGDIKTSVGRILISTSSINLARLGLKHHINQIDTFYEELEDILELCKNQLLQRFEIQANKYKENYEYLFEDEVLYDAKKLESGQKVRKVLRNGAFEIGYVGLGECICALQDKSTLDKKDINLAFEILEFMKERIMKFTKESKLNFILCETTDRNICKNMLAIDKSVYGDLEVLKKREYGSFLKMLSIVKLDMDTWLEIQSKLQNLSGMVAFVNLPKNYSPKKLLEILKQAFLKQVEYLKVQVGKHEN